MPVPDSRTFRFLFVGTLMTATAGVILWSAWLFRPQRDETIRAAIKNHNGPAIWWPPSWRAEHREVVPLLKNRTKVDLTDEKIATFKSFGGGRNAFWAMIQTLRDEESFDRAITLVYLSACDFEYRGWDEEMAEFQTVLQGIPDEEFPYDHAGYVLIQIAPHSKAAVPQLVRALELAFVRKAELDSRSDTGSFAYHGPSWDQPVGSLALGLGKLGPDAKEAVPVLARILAHEKRRLWRDSVFVDHKNFRPLNDVIYESLLLIDPTAAQTAAE